MSQVKNILGLGGIVLAVLVPVFIRYAWKSDLADAASEANVGAIQLPPDSVADSTPVHYNDQYRNAKLVFLDADGRELPPRPAGVDFATLNRRREAIQSARASLRGRLT